jgi:hypothetical protein
MILIRNARAAGSLHQSSARRAATDRAAVGDGYAKLQAAAVVAAATAHGHHASAARL